MRPVYKLAAILFVTLLISCAPTQYYYSKTGLSRVEIGQTKAQVKAMFPGEPSAGGAPGMQITAATKAQDGRLVEVGEVLLSDGGPRPKKYTFVFNDGVLVRWY
jgi:hypothetical protein